jgi:hypothetical protein
MKSDATTCETRDILTSRWRVFMLYWLPAIAIVAVGPLAITSGLRAVVWTVALATMGMACILNVVLLDDSAQENSALPAMGSTAETPDLQPKRNHFNRVGRLLRCEPCHRNGSCGSQREAVARFTLSTRIRPRNRRPNHRSRPLSLAKPVSLRRESFPGRAISQSKESNNEDCHKIR